MTRINRANFGSKSGVILAPIGLAAGLGNIRGFPHETGNHGDTVLVLTYLGYVFLLGLPILIAGFLIGCRSRANTTGAYQKLVPGTHQRWTGRMGVLAALLILSYYSVVAGRTLEYVCEALMSGFTGRTPTEFISSFQQFSDSPWRPVLWLVLFLLVTHFIIIKGVEKDIERSPKIMILTLPTIILILVVCPVTLPGVGAGVEFPLKPDLSKVDGNVLLSAMGQAFFSPSLGMGCFCTYTPYLSRETNLAKATFSVGVINTFIVILAGFIIFPAAFSVDIQPDVGPSLIFITLPNIFQQVFSRIPILVYISSVIFCVLFTMAVLTSIISLHEAIIAYLHEEFNLTRDKVARLATGGCIFLGILCSLSLEVMKGFIIFRLGILDLLDFITAKTMLTLDDLCISIFTGWHLDKKVIWSGTTNNGSLKVPMYKPVIFILGCTTPTVISLIFINELGPIKL